MEKLIELLQIYDNRDNLIGDIQYRIENWNVQRSVKWTDRWVNVWWYSKSFWFIKRLVDNDKIDLWEKLFNLTKNDNKKSMICDLDNNDFSWEDTFLMLLSISNSPIEDLILYLK